MKFDLIKYNKAFFDTAPFIYLIEEHPDYINIVQEIFQQVDAKIIKAITSYLTLLEVLVKPLQEEKQTIANKYKEILLKSSTLILIPMDEKIAIEAAKLRASYNIKTPDSIQLATAIIGKADIFITNDESLKKVESIEIIILKDYL